EGTALHGQIEAVGELAINGLDANPEPAALDLAVTQQALHDRLGQARRNREADALISARATHDRIVDADQLAAGVDQRTTRVARVDGGIGLQEILVLMNAELAALGSRDDAHRHRLPDAEGIAHGEHDVT